MKPSENNTPHVAIDNPQPALGPGQELRFRVVGGDDETIRDFDLEHERRMHLILARHDLTGFQHLHPEQADDGTWATPVRLDHAGDYRLFADFSSNGESRTLAADFSVGGDVDERPLPPPRPTSISDGGYEVRLDAHDVRPAAHADLRFEISRDGEPVEVEPYLGAGGHLVALREGDLAFLHVHPAGDGTEFMASFPTPGNYRLFLQFKHGGRVHTAAFTQQVA